MPIRIELDALLAERRMTQTELAARIGITAPNLNVLKTGKAKAIRFSTLSALCRELGCQPGDILRWEAGADQEGEEE
jgi:putative transcriptional regulator